MGACLAGNSAHAPGASQPSSIPARDNEVRGSLKLTAQDILTTTELNNFKKQHEKTSLSVRRSNFQPSDEMSIQTTNDEDTLQTLHAVPFPNSQFENVESDGYYNDDERENFEKSKPNAPSFGSKTEFRRGEIIGRGAFGTVFMGLNVNNGELMAVKEVQIVSTTNAHGVRESDQYVVALEREIALLSQLSHRNIVRYIGTQRDEKRLFIFLEFVSGGSIASLLKTFGRFGDQIARVYTKQILDGLHYLHSHRIVHRDIKGGNILIDNNGVAKLADFGASRKLADVSSQGGGDSNLQSLQGTPYWMAPEVIRQTGHGRQADIWSLGCTVIEMLTGKPPWHQFKTQVSALFHIASATEPPEIPNVPLIAKDFILQCLQRNPRDRPNALRLLQHPFVRNVDVANDPSHNPGVVQISPIEELESKESENTETVAHQTWDEYDQSPVVTARGIDLKPAEVLSPTRTSANSEVKTPRRNSAKKRRKSSKKSKRADRKVIEQYLFDHHQTRLDHLDGDFKVSYVRGHTPDKSDESKRDRARSSKRYSAHSLSPHRRTSSQRYQEEQKRSQSFRHQNNGASSHSYAQKQLFMPVLSPHQKESESNSEFLLHVETDNATNLSEVGSLSMSTLAVEDLEGSHDL